MLKNDKLARSKCAQEIQTALRPSHPQQPCTAPPHSDGHAQPGMSGLFTSSSTVYF